MVETDPRGHIHDLLQDLPPTDGEVVINWAHFGSLAEVNHRLASVVAFPANTEVYAELHRGKALETICQIG